MNSIITLLETGSGRFESYLITDIGFSTNWIDYSIVLANAVSSSSTGPLQTGDTVQFIWDKATGIGGAINPSANTNTQLLANALQPGYNYLDIYFGTGPTDLTSPFPNITKVNASGSFADFQYILPAIGTSSNLTFGTLELTGSLTASGDISSSATGSFGELAGIVDTLAETPSLNDYLVFNGTSFISVPQGTTFTFSIADFDMNQIGTSLIGTGVWKTAGAITFTATYDNGPPDDATVSIEGTNAPSISDFTMDSPSFSIGDTNVDVNYPSNIGNIKFRLTANKGATSDNDVTDQIAYFNNFRAYGSLANNTSLTSANITTLYSQNQNLTNSSYITITGLTVGSGEYFSFAYRDALTDPVTVRCGTGNNILTVAMDPSDATNKTPATTQISYTNTNSFTENYRVIASKITDITGHSTTIQIPSPSENSTQVVNYFYWGRDVNTGQETEAGVEALEYKNSSYDDGTITDPTLLSVGTLSGQYIYIAIPSRYGVNGTNYQLKDNGTNLPLDSNSPVVVAITNPVGFQENYEVYRSTNQLTQATPFTIKIDAV